MVSPPRERPRTWWSGSRAGALFAGPAGGAAAGDAALRALTRLAFFASLVMTSRAEALADAECGIDWEINVDSTSVRAHQHAPGLPQVVAGHHARTAGGLHPVRAGHGQDPRAYDKRGYVFLGTVTAAALMIWPRS
ncbi:hypothetical protein [Streptomyces sp. ISL-86]|uniref:hypothetical protein n=1 Tax=Streptomyces sp. ISL-86 TaxID=2819187 RepID=UPI001BEBC60D|nr:hypothetical protein [Streptomyces sp. ISL-86]MBT2454901.1 hypothetical protein [Streptomyces sp. ISL-86]